ncbi:MAG: superoxide dismutase [Linnemannia gamsii]|nr:MAG: superoxide dismutase [Linnemannia gamsii]
MLLKTFFVLSALAVASYTCQAQGQLVASQIMAAAIDMNGIEANFMFAPLANNGGAQVWIEVKSGLSKTFAVSPTGGFEYHIHVKPVGSNNDCMATGGHLDPTNIGAAKCMPAKPDRCQEGDLSGKHGELKATESGFIAPISYNDKSIHFSGETTTIAGRSVVIHNNGTRVACANIFPYEQSTYPSPSAEDTPEVRTSHSDAGRAVATMALVIAGTVLSALVTL